MGKPEPRELKQIVDNLNNGGILLFPSDTLWALGCDAENDTAVNKISILKGQKGPMVILVSSLRMLLHYVPQLHPKAGDLIEYYEKPLTILYKDCQYIAEKARADDGTVAIRVVKDAVCATMINYFGRAIVGTMATKKDDKLPFTFRDVPADIRKSVDYTAKYNMEFKGSRASVIAGIDAKNELFFIRKE